MYRTELPLFVAMGLVTQEELDMLYNQAYADMNEEQYGCMCYLLSVWGQRPL